MRLQRLCASWPAGNPCAPILPHAGRSGRVVHLARTAEQTLRVYEELL
jgi:hypothetical protein